MKSTAHTRTGSQTTARLRQTGNSHFIVSTQRTVLDLSGFFLCVEFNLKHPIKPRIKECADRRDEAQLLMEVRLTLCQSVSSTANLLLHCNHCLSGN